MRELRRVGLRDFKPVAVQGQPFGIRGLQPRSFAERFEGREGVALLRQPVPVVTWRATSSRRRASPWAVMMPRALVTRTFITVEITATATSAMMAVTRSAASARCRPTHLRVRSRVVTGRARIGSPFLQRSRSSAKASAEP